MGSLIKITSVPFESVRFSQSARLIPSDMVTVERQKVLARHRAYQLRVHGSTGSSDIKYLNQVRRAFSSSSHVEAMPVSHTSSQTLPSRAVASSRTSAATGSVQNAVSSPAPEGTSVSVSQDAGFSQASSEASSAYLVQRGAFELRVAKGEVAYVPALAMTIVTQYPEVHFEYTGDFNYVPPRDETSGAAVDMQI